MMAAIKVVAIPPEIAARLAPLALLRSELLANIITRDAGKPFIRAAWNTASIWPKKVERTYRFGPPEALAGLTGFPFHWIYVAEDAYTAAWEAQLCRNDVTRPGIVGQADAIHGFIYPSRRHPGKTACAISSRKMDLLSNTMTRSWIKFSDSPAHARLLADHLRTDPP